MRYPPRIWLCLEYPQRKVFQAYQKNVAALHLYKLMVLASIPGNIYVLQQLQHLQSETRYHELPDSAPISTFSALWNRHILATNRSALFRLHWLFWEVEIVRDFQKRDIRIR